MKHDPEVKIYYSDRYFNISQEISHNACPCKLPSWNKIFYFNISLRYPTLEVQYSKILSGGIDFISLIQRIHLVVYTGQVSRHLNDKIFSQVGVL